MIRIILALTFVSTAFTTLAEQTLIHNIKGYTLTGDGGSTGNLQQFDALVFAGGKVLFTGTKKQALTKFQDSRQIDGAGKTLIPGLTDAHGHVLGLGSELSNVNLRGTQSEKEAVDRVAAFADSNASQRWIVGRGWNQVLWPSKSFPTRESLDQIKIDKPIVLSRVDGHAVWVNSKALQVAGISKDTVDPAGGQIVRDESGEPTGVLIDNAEMLVTKHIPQTSVSELNAKLDQAFQHLLKLGITSVHDAGIGQPMYQLYQQRLAEGKLPVRIYGMLSGASENLESWLKAGRIADSGDMLSIRSVKLYSDGALGSRGAAMLKGYSDEPDNIGLLVTQENTLNDLVEAILGYGFQANVHAIGDRGNRLTINAFDRAYAKVGGLELRNRIEHAQVISVKDIPRIKKLNLIASMQPVHATSDMNMAEDRVGPMRILGAYAWRTLLDKNIVIASGSDFPVELAEPFHGIHAAVMRQNHKNQPEGGWKANEKMTLAEALQSFTLSAAYAAHQENVLGSLEPGKWADFILLDQNIFEIAPEKLWQTQVEQTWIAGERRY